MTIELTTKRIIDLTGPDGNAPVLLRYAKKLAKESNKDYQNIRFEMMASNYMNLVKVFDREFGSIVTLLS